MSSFGGKLEEYSAISIDKFDDRNLLSTAFFLSHCHADHMVGLSSPQFHKRLQTSSLKLYTSVISRAFLLADEAYAHLTPYIESLPLDEPMTLQIPDENMCKVVDLVVTLLPAGHCPGSVMFLFEGEEGAALYTGDFRIATGDASKFKNLHLDGRVKSIRSMYVDTTFCCPKSMHFPTREQSRRALIDVVDSWLSRSVQHVIYLNCSAQFGYEYLFVELYKHFNMKVHISDRKMKKYEGVQEILEAVTTDKQATRIHACYFPKFVTDNRKRKTCKKFRSLPCGYLAVGPNQPVTKTVKMSIMWYAVSVTAEDIVMGKPDSSYARVCFSTHSSYTEIVELVRYINPAKVFPNVVPVGGSYREVADRLTSVLTKGKVAPNNEAQLLGSLKRPRSRNDIASVESNLLFDSDTCSPTFKKHCPSSAVPSLDQASSQQTDDSSYIESPRVINDGLDVDISLPRVKRLSSPSDISSLDQASSQQTNDSSYVESPRLTNAGLVVDSSGSGKISSMEALSAESVECSSNPFSQDLFTEISSVKSEEGTIPENVTEKTRTGELSNFVGTNPVEVIELTSEEVIERKNCDIDYRSSSPDILILQCVQKYSPEYDSDETTDRLSGTPGSQQLLTLDSSSIDITTPDQIHYKQNEEVKQVVRKISFD